MLRLAKAFWDLALWRLSPAQLPASVFLLSLVAAIVALFEVLGALLPPASTDWIVVRILLSVGLHSRGLGEYCGSRTTENAFCRPQ